jgi:hypothetical protein
VLDTEFEVYSELEAALNEARSRLLFPTIANIASTIAKRMRRCRGFSTERSLSDAASGCPASPIAVTHEPGMRERLNFTGRNTATMIVFRGGFPPWCAGEPGRPGMRQPYL